MSSFREKLFTYRSYTPIPFLLLMIGFARPTTTTVIVGGIIATLGELTRFWGVAYAGSLTRVTGSVGAPAVVVAGPYARVRNPLYIGNILMYTGIGIMSNALFPWIPLLALVFFGWQYAVIVSLEEEFLTKQFGSTYADYVSAVPRFFPRITRFVHPAQELQRPNWKEALVSERRTLQAFGLVVAIVLVLWYRG